MQGAVIRRRRRGLSRRSLSFFVGLVLAATSLSAAGPARAQFGNGPGANVGCQDVNGQATCVSGVVFRANGTGATVAAPSNWTPPACWYEPSPISPTFLKLAYLIPLFGTLIAWLTGMDTGTNGDFHDGQKGGWWGFVYNPSMSVADAQAQCDLPGYPILQWVPDATPAPPDAVTSWKMAAAAAKIIPVDRPTLDLSPIAANQVVNLPTLVSFAAGLPRTSVTASLNVNGFALAATTIATPASVTVNAGSPDASPSSCTYALALSGGDYQIDPSTTRCSDGSSGPTAGIVYRRPTPVGATFPVTATVTWNVTWTDTASPNDPPQAAPALGPLTLTTLPVGVTVKEVESANK